MKPVSFILTFSVVYARRALMSPATAVLPWVRRIVHVCGIDSEGGVSISAIRAGQQNFAMCQQPTDVFATRSLPTAATDASLKVSAPSFRGGVAICFAGDGTSTASGARSLEATMASTLVGKQAVVIGAGMGGLAAAGALADFFDQVVVLERDTLP